MSKPYAGMSLERYDWLVQRGSPSDLTEGEIGAGWHYCDHGWDGLLISPIDLEYKYCNCKNQEKYKKSPEYYERYEKAQEAMEKLAKLDEETGL